MKDQHDNTTIDVFEVKRGSGRPRRYASNAERQAAYRARRSALPLPAPVVSQPASVPVAVDLADSARQLVARLVPSSLTMTMTVAERHAIYDRLSGAWDLALAAGSFEAAEVLHVAMRHFLANVTVTK